MTSRARGRRAPSPVPRWRRSWSGPWRRSRRGPAHWSKRELAKRAGISPAGVHRIWRAFGLQPHRTGDFKVSPDPLLTGKIRDVMGRYLAPPANAVVFAVDEKPQIQALQRTAPVLPMLPGTPERRSHDYVRHGAAGLFAALNTAAGKVTGKLSARHRAVGFRDFPDETGRPTGPGLAIRVICDDLSACKAPVVQRLTLPSWADRCRSRKVERSSAYMRRGTILRRNMARSQRHTGVRGRRKAIGPPLPTSRRSREPDRHSLIR